MKQEQRLHFREYQQAGGRVATDRWSAIWAEPKPECEAGAGRPRTNVRPRRSEAQDEPDEGRGTGRLRLSKPSAPEHARRALGGGAA
jgi:hypothetical protein